MSGLDEFLLDMDHIPNREFVGFHSLGPGTGDAKMQAPKAPKNGNSPGTLLEPFAAGLQSWANMICPQTWV